VNLGRRNVVIEAIGGAVGATFALDFFGWPDGWGGAGVGLLGLLGGLIAAFGVVQALDWRVESGRVALLEAEIARLEHLNTLLRYQTDVAKAEAEINGVWMKRQGEAYDEAIRTGRVLPFEALMARIQTDLKVKGLDEPIPRPEGI
jgi:hypothetical protein